MNICIYETSSEMARQAASAAARAISQAIAKRGEARILLSTGESQIETLGFLAKEQVSWDKVTMFHLDEYIGLPESHKASFRKYLKERFLEVFHPGKAYLVSGEGNVEENIAALTASLREAPVDVALVGIGENGHVAFNDPPADFDTKEAYMVVNLAERCKQQQVNEGWFGSLEEVPAQAITMTVPQIMASRTILSIVPGVRKSEAVCKTLLAKAVTSQIPATVLKTHPDWHLFLDRESAGQMVPAI